MLVEGGCFMTNVSGLEINEVAVGFVPVCGVGYEVEMI